MASLFIFYRVVAVVRRCRYYIVMLLTVLAIFTAVFYLFHVPKIRHWNLIACYLVCLFCAWTGLVLSPDVFPPIMLKMAGGTLVVMALTIFSFDLFLAIFRRIQYAVLSRFRPLPPLPPHLMELSRAIDALAGRKTGALVILERKNKLDGYVSGGMPFDAQVKAEVLIALFQTNSPVHDGAIILSNDRIKRVKTILPLATHTPLPLGIGTRHRSAIGITERTDSIAVVVSEERGEISIAYRGSLVRTPAQKEFIKLLRTALRGRRFELSNTRK